MMLEQSSIGAAQKIMHSSDVKGALKEIVQIYVEEDKKGNFMSEQLEIFEYIWAYTKSDQPFGFFKIGMTSIMKLISEIKTQSFLSHCKVVPGIRQLIELTNVLIVEKPHEYIEYHMIIADFLLLFMENVDKQTYLFDLFSSHAKAKTASKGSSAEQEDSGSVFLPFKIALYLLKQVNPLDKTGLLEKVLQIIRLWIPVFDDSGSSLIDKLNAIYQKLPKSLKSSTAINRKILNFIFYSRSLWSKKPDRNFL